MSCCPSDQAELSAVVGLSAGQMGFFCNAFKLMRCGFSMGSVWGKTDRAREYCSPQLCQLQICCGGSPSMSWLGGDTQRLANEAFDKQLLISRAWPHFEISFSVGLKVSQAFCRGKWPHRWSQNQGVLFSHLALVLILQRSLLPALSSFGRPEQGRACSCAKVDQ